MPPAGQSSKFITVPSKLLYTVPYTILLMFEIFVLENSVSPWTIHVIYAEHVEHGPGVRQEVIHNQKSIWFTGS